MSDQLKTIAVALQSLTYNEMIDIASHVSTCVEDATENGFELDENYFASVLLGWAETETIGVTE